MPAEFKITNLKYELEDDLGNFNINEVMYPIKVRYEGPFFYCDATVRCVVPTGETWYVGFLQTCDAITLRHSYASGNYTQWEFPTSISDATSQTFPYYSTGAPVASGRRNQSGMGAYEFVGPIERSRLFERSFSMNDNLGSNVQWWDPVPSGQTNHSPEWPHTLTRIERKQRFSTFLVASQGIPNRADVQYSILCMIVWRMHLIIDFNCSLPLGSRATKSFGKKHEILGVVRDGSATRLPNASFVNMNANAVQQLVGYDAANTKVKPHISW